MGVPATLAVRTPRAAIQSERVVRPQQVAPPSIVPAVEPIEYQSIAPDDARAFNSAIPFVPGPNPAARPFRFTGSADDRARAIDCLAAAGLYEAGDDGVGQRAVVQVVLNRLRHPAFPKSVCGVVFQGSERRTGCQFTFTCDGALARRHADDAWERAREIASAALSGTVFAPVGYATHYHTNWVIPYWSSSLDKVAKVDTHLFFRWTGWWGTPPAFTRKVAATEPRVPQLALWFDAHKLPQVLTVESEVAGLVGERFAPSAVPAPVAGDANVFTVALDPAVAPDRYLTLAAQACGERSYCKFLGWRDATAVPGNADGIPDASSLARMSFSYLRNRDQNFERALWNCEQLPRPAGQCMRRTAVALPALPPKPEAGNVLTVLPGVRRRIDTVPAPARTPSSTPR